MIQSPAGYQGDVRIKRYLDFYQAGYGVAMLSSGTTAFTPASLFAASEPGGWYDPSDLSTLYQDAAGTTPVTAVEQPVGLVLDKSRGLVLGPELVTNGDFSNGTTGWTAGSATGSVATIAVSSGELVVTNTFASGFGKALQSITCTIGKSYKVEGLARVISASTGRAAAYLVNSTGGYIGPATNEISVTTPSPITMTFVATATTHYIGVGVGGVAANAGATFGFDNISVRELPGNHLSQSTAAARPVLSSRVNLLTYTEQFDNAAWAKAGVTITTNAATDPIGGSTADKVVATSVNTSKTVYQTPGTSSNASYTATCYLKAAEYSYGGISIVLNTDRYAACVDLTNGTLGSTNTVGSPTGTSYSITSVGSGWYRLTVTATGGAGTMYIQVFPSNVASPTWTSNVPQYAGDGTSGVYIWGADLRPANAGVGLPSYQRVGAATDYDTTGFPLYLKFDGTDDFLQSSTITPGADKAQVFAGVRKLSDAATGVLFELSDASAGTTGWIGLYAPSGASQNYAVRARGTGDNVRNYTTYASPLTNVLAASVTSTASNSADAISFKVNGANNVGVDAISTTSTGNFSSYPLYVGSRGGTSNRFNGQLYSLILRFSAANLDAATITATETWVNGKTKAF